MTIARSATFEGALAEDDPRLTRPDGEKWPMIAVLGDRFCLANDASALLGEIIDGYPVYAPPSTENGEETLDSREGVDDEAAYIRWEHACMAATQIQGMYCDDAAQQGRFDPAEETEETLTALFQDRSLPVAVTDWTHTIPLVLVTTNYSPATALPPPMGKDGGEVIWLDPTDETKYLRSLANAGAFEYRFQDDVHQPKTED
jgi:hypothetical protein